MSKVVWKHEKTGGLYLTVAFAVEEATMTPVVVYQKIGEKGLWTRPCHEFFDGRFTPGAMHDGGPVKNPDPAPLVGEQATEAVAETRHVEPRRPMQLRVKPVPEEAPETDNIFRDEDPAMFTHGGQVARRDTTLVAPRPAEAMGDRG